MVRRVGTGMRHFNPQLAAPGIRISARGMVSVETSERATAAAPAAAARAATGVICARRAGWLLGRLNLRSFAERFNLRGVSPAGGGKVFGLWSAADSRLGEKSMVQWGQSWASGDAAEWKRGEVFAAV